MSLNASSRLSLVLIGCLLVGLTASATAADNTELKAGAAARVVNPTKPAATIGHRVMTMFLNVYADLRVQALVLEDASGKRIVWLGYDFCVPPAPMVDRIKKRIHAEHGIPQRVTGTVRTLSDGVYEEHERRHGGGRRHSQGPTAVVRVPSGDGTGLLVLTTARAMPNSIHQITSVGIAPQQQKILVAKGAVAPRAAYEPVSPRLIEVDSGGACWIGRGPDSYQRANKNLYEWNR